MRIGVGEGEGDVCGALSLGDWVTNHRPTGTIAADKATSTMAAAATLVNAPVERRRFKLVPVRSVGLSQFKTLQKTNAVQRHKHHRFLGAQRA